MNKFLLYFLILSVCASARAAEVPKAIAAISLAEAIEVALAKSPDIRALENQFDSASAKTRLALMPSEPTLTVGFNDLTQFFNLSTQASNTYQITQPLGFPGRAALNSAQLGDQAEALNYQLRAQKLQISLNVKQAYYGLQLARHNIELNTSTRLAYERILAIAKRRFENNQTTQVDYLNAQIALLSNQNDLSDLQAAERIARAQLNVLLYNPPAAPVEVDPIRMVYHPAVNFDEAISRMLANRNEIHSARSSASAASKAYKLAWMSILPDFQIIAGTTFYRVASASPYSSTPEATATGNYPTHTFVAGIQFTVPIWFLLNEREAIIGASHDRAAADANVDSVLNQSKVALETAVDSVNALREKIDNFERHLLPMLEQSFNAALANYGVGKIDFQMLSDTAAARRAQRLAYAQAVTSYLTNYAAYGQLIGEDL